MLCHMILDEVYLVLPLGGIIANSIMISWFLFETQPRINTSKPMPHRLWEKGRLGRIPNGTF